MERRSKEFNLTPKNEIVIPIEGGLLKYNTDDVLTLQISELDKNGQFSKIKEGAGCKAILIVLKNKGE